MAVETLLVTGASGFVGSHVVEACSAGGLRLRALVRRPEDVARLERLGVSCVRGSLEDREALEGAIQGVDGVLHLAAATRARSLEGYARTNATGTRAVVEAMLSVRARPRRLVYLSSLAAAGPSADGRPITPDDPPKPLTAYGRTKLAGERVCEAAAGEMEIVILRAPAVYGPRDRDVLRFFRMARKGVLLLPAGPVRTLQMVHASDLARALLLAATTQGAGGTYHIAEARSYAWEEVARLIASAVGREAHILRVPPRMVLIAGLMSETLSGLVGRSTIFNRDKVRELLAPAWLCETSLARRDLGFEAEIPLAVGLSGTAAWYRDHGWL